MVSLNSSLNAAFIRRSFSSQQYFPEHWQPKTRCQIMEMPESQERMPHVENVRLMKDAKASDAGVTGAQCTSAIRTGLTGRSRGNSLPAQVSPLFPTSAANVERTPGAEAIILEVRSESGTLNLQTCPLEANVASTKDYSANHDSQLQLILPALSQFEMAIPLGFSRATSDAFVITAGSLRM